MKAIAIIPFLKRVIFPFYYPHPRTCLTPSGCPNLSPTDVNVEPLIFPLVSALNIQGVCKTIASCQGHLATLNPPYVTFAANLQFADALEARIYDFALHDVFFLYWVVEANFASFENQRHLIFKMSPSEPSWDMRMKSSMAKAKNATQSWEHIYTQIVQDFKMLAGLVRETEQFIQREL